MYLFLLYLNRSSSFRQTGEFFFFFLTKCLGYFPSHRISLGQVSETGGKAIARVWTHLENIKSRKSYEM